jgi:TolB protein
MTTEQNARDRMLSMNRRQIFLGAAGLAVASAMPTGRALAQLRIDITRGQVQPIPIAVSPFLGADGDAATGRQMRDVIASNLERSGLFKAIDPAAHIQSPEQLRNAAPRFVDWRQINAQALPARRVPPVGRVRRGAAGGTRLHHPGDQLAARGAHHLGRDLQEDHRRGRLFRHAHRLHLETGPRDRRVKRLAIMDQDGANHRFLTDGRTLVADAALLALGAGDHLPHAYVNNAPRASYLSTSTAAAGGRGRLPGMTFAPRFSPDGNRVICRCRRKACRTSIRGPRTGGSGGSPARRRARRLALLLARRAQIVFNSDRGGDQQIYVMDAGGGNIRRISFGRGRYATPVWSPRGDLIAFTRFGGGSFAIGVMRPDGSGERILSEGWAMEGPTFAPGTAAC